jgi:hypothetical protein
MSTAVTMDVPAVSMSCAGQHYHAAIWQQDHSTGEHGAVVQPAVATQPAVQCAANPTPIPARTEAAFPVQPRQLQTALLGLPAAETMPADVTQQFGFFPFYACAAVARFPRVGLRSSTHQQHPEGGTKERTQPTCLGTHRLLPTTRTPTLSVMAPTCIVALRDG